MNARLARLLVLALCMGLAACRSVDFEAPRTVSYAPRDTADTRLARLVAPELRGEPGESGFYLLLDGIDALAARLAMADLADRSLDAQYFLLTDDLIGLLFVGALLDAADRGVQVRFLLDDIQTSGYDAGIAALDSHPNLQIRIFNPFGDRTTRAGDVLLDFSRINRRMHNKAMTADNQVTILGGRNIAAEYFNADDDVNFDDTDVLAIGPVVGEVSEMFDAYWNHRASLTAEAFARLPDDPEAELERLRQDIASAREEVADTPWARAVQESVDYFVDEEAEDEDFYTLAPYRLVYDSPDKSLPAAEREPGSILSPLLEVIDEARSEFILISPYFVPLDSGIDLFRSLRERGVEVIVLSNSLASTNHAIVHSGYAPARKPLLEAGVRLFEMKPSALLYGIERAEKLGTGATLHTKGFLVDRERLFVGSFNWDPRSIDINTEMGVMIESPELAGPITQNFFEEVDSIAWEVALDERGRLVWIDRGGEEPVVHTREPETTFWQRLSVSLLRLLPIDSQL